MSTPGPKTSTERGIPVLAPIPPVAIAITAMVSIQFGAALAATLFDRAGPTGVSAVRLVMGALILLAAVRPWRRPHTPEALRIAVAFGVLLGLMNLLFYLAIDRVPLGIVVTIEFLGPISVGALYSPRRRDLIWCALALVGVVLLAEPWQTGGGALDTLGIVFALGAAALWGLYILVAERVGRAFDGTDGLAIAMVFGALIALVAGMTESGTDMLDPTVLVVGTAVALLSTVFPYTLEMEALRRIPAGVFGILQSLEPGIAALAGLLVLGETLDAEQLGAIGLVVVASVGVTRSSRIAAEAGDPLGT